MYRLAADKELDIKTLSKFITDHDKEVKDRYKKLRDAYRTKYRIFDLKKKAEWKPDNRIAVNFAKYVVDTMNGFFMGIPVKVSCPEDDSIDEFVSFIGTYNDIDDSNAELSKICDIYGKGYEMYYVDENGNIGITYLSPIDAFMIFDDSVLERPRYFVRTYLDADKVLHGSVSDDTVIRWFNNKNGMHWEADEKIHGFNGVPATEYRENEEEIGLFEPALTMIDAYNKAISEKANDVDYFADAYMKILGAALDEKALRDIRTNRVINLAGEGSEKVIVDFLQKPDGDTTQENLIDRLEKLIFQICMVANISDESFGSASGIALRYKLKPMSDLAKTKERKFTSGMNRRYMLIFSNPITPVHEDDWVKLKYKFTLNYPANLEEESNIAKNLGGVTSKQTQLGVLSIIDNVGDEIDMIERENDKLSYDTDYPTNRTTEE